jgi:threonine 3-dehydrogenase
MRSVSKAKEGRGISLTTSNIPKVHPGEALIKVKTAGICGTDLHIFKWDEWSQKRIKTPLIIGHEFVGEICELGSESKGRGLTVGQRVSAEGHITCGHCKYCRTGLGHICKDVEIIGVDRDGCFAEYISIPISNIWPVHDSIPDKYAAVFDPLGNAMHTVMSQDISSKTVLITGAGSIGLFAIPIAIMNGASKVIVIEPSDYKKDIALKLGADVVFNPNEADLKENIIELTDGLGPDVLLEMSGNKGSIKLGLEVLSNGGTASLLGIPAGEMPFNLAETVIFKGITIHGITGRRMFDTWYQCDNFLQRNGNLIDPIVTHTLDLNEVEKGFELMEQNKAVKVLLEI